MKATLATLVLISMMIASTAWAGNDSASVKDPEAKNFDARISNLKGDTLLFWVVNPDDDKVILKVYSDRNTKVLHYKAGKKEVLRLSFLMEDMRRCKYTAVVERNDAEVLRKEFELK